MIVSIFMYASILCMLFHTHIHTHAVTSTVVKPVPPDVAKHYIEVYYKKLELRLSELEKTAPAPTSKKSKKKSSSSKRNISFNQSDSHRHHKLSGLGSRHPRRMSVDVNLLIGQNESQSSQAKLFKRAGSVRSRPHALYISGEKLN